LFGGRGAPTLTPRDDEAHLLRGLARARLGNHEGAPTDFTAAVAVNPKNAATRFNRALLHVARKDYVQAKRDLEEAISLDRELGQRVPAGDAPR